MSTTLIIVLVVVFLLLDALILGGFLASRRRSNAPDYLAHVADADRALEAARAADRGWHRDLIEAAARSALARERSDFEYSELHLVLVDDQPGVTDDRAHVMAVGGRGQARVILTRSPGGEWFCESIQ